MDAEPPKKPAIEHVRPLEDASQGKDNRLIIDINDAHYNPETGVATVQLKHAWFKAYSIWSYKGEDITLRYKGHEIDLDECPKVDVSKDNVKLSTNFFRTSATIGISGVSIKLAADIQEQNCLVIDADTVKDILKRGYKKPRVDPKTHEP